MKTSTRSLATGAGALVAVMSVLAAGVSIRANSADSARSKAASPVRSIANAQSQSTGVRVASASGSDIRIGIGPDPFALPLRKVHEADQIPFRKKYRTDTIFLGRYTVEPPVREHPPISPLKTTDDPAVRMAGFLLGNGVYAVLETRSNAVVVNPGDRIDDGRVVTEIRPNETRLRGEGYSTYTARLHP